MHVDRSELAGDGQSRPTGGRDERRLGTAGLRLRLDSAADRHPIAAAGADGTATSDLAYAAARHCLHAAATDGSDIDLVVVATMTPDQPVPSTACLLQQRLGLRAAAMDLNAACAGFMYALVTGAQFIKTGACRQVLVVGADTNTRIVNPADPKTYPLFGDGAGAVLLGAGHDARGCWPTRWVPRGRGRICWRSLPVARGRP